MMSSAKENILYKIKKSKLAHTEQVFSISDNTEIYKPILPNAEICFKTELESISGKCEIFDTEKDLFNYLKKLLSEKNIHSVFCREDKLAEKLVCFKIPSTQKNQDFELMEVAITGCDFLIARTGSVVITSSSQSGRQLISFPPIHIVLADVSQLLNYVEDAYTALLKKYRNNFPSQVTTITGPSRTADIEKTLVLGAHGPKEFIVLLCREKFLNNFAI